MYFSITKRCAFPGGLGVECRGGSKSENNWKSVTVEVTKPVVQPEVQPKPNRLPQSQPEPHSKPQSNPESKLPPEMHPLSKLQLELRSEQQAKVQPKSQESPQLQPQLVIESKPKQSKATGTSTKEVAIAEADQSLLEPKPARLCLL